MGPRKMWRILLRKKKEKKLSKSEYVLIVKTVNRFFDIVVKKDKCIAQATILAYFLNSQNKLVIKLGFKNQNYDRYQRLVSQEFLDSSTAGKRDFHCWLTFNNEPVVQPFYEHFWTTIYDYEI